MNGKKLYTVFLVTMLLLAAFGAWVMVDGAIAYGKTPRLEQRIWDREVLSSLVVSLPKKA